MSVNPIPEGMQALIPSLCVNDGQGAIAFYQKALGATEGMPAMTGPDGKVMHAELRIGDCVLFLHDEMGPEWGMSAKHYGGSPASIMLYVKDCDALYKQAIKAGATSKAEPTDMFWGDRCGTIEDPYGYKWTIATHVKDVSPEEMMKAMEAMGAPA